MKKELRFAAAYAPATVGNACVGFDSLGFCFGQVGDTITVSKRELTGEAIEGAIEIIGISGHSSNIPMNAATNTAAIALYALLQAHKLDHGFSIQIEKGIWAGSGLGSSAASAVGAVVAANALLHDSLSRKELLTYALKGEEAASKAAHADNVAPCLYGGITLAHEGDGLEILQLPYPDDIWCTVVHPQASISTAKARSVLKTHLDLKSHVRQSSSFAAFVAGLCQQNMALIKRSMEDTLIEPQRASLIPGFYEAKTAALDSGALGFSISGAGPSVFGWAACKEVAEEIKKNVIDVFHSKGLDSDAWVGPIEKRGAHIINETDKSATP